MDEEDGSGAVGWLSGFNGSHRNVLASCCFEKKCLPRGPDGDKLQVDMNIQNSTQTSNTASTTWCHFGVGLAWLNVAVRFTPELPHGFAKNNSRTTFDPPKPGQAAPHSVYFKTASATECNGRPAGSDGGPRDSVRWWVRDKRDTPPVCTRSGRIWHHLETEVLRNLPALTKRCAQKSPGSLEGLE